MIIDPRQLLYRGRALRSIIIKRKANWKNASIQPKYRWPVKANPEKRGLAEASSYFGWSTLIVCAGLASLCERTFSLRVF
jgi:hypothetical protein